MNIENEYLPADHQDIDNITTLAEDYTPEPCRYLPVDRYDEDEDTFVGEDIILWVWAFVGLGAMSVIAFLAYLYFMN